MASTVIATASMVTSGFSQGNDSTQIDSLQLYLQDSTETDDDVVVFGIILEEYPSPIGGYEPFYKTIYDGMLVPENLKEKLKIFVQIEIDTSGSIADVNVVKGLNEQLNNEVIRAIRESKQKFEPAKQRGKTIPSKIVIPVVINPNKNSN